MEIIGIEEVSYTSKKDGNLVEGVRVFMAEPVQRGTGVKVTDAFVSRKKLQTFEEPIKLGDDVTPYYNRFGTFEGFFHNKI